MTNHKVKCSNFEIANDKPFTLISGPCQLENETHAMKISTELKKITEELGINLIYKTSFDKANRTSIDGTRGLGFESGLELIRDVAEHSSVKTCVDFHEPHQIDRAFSQLLLPNIIQIPAFLCRQTDLLISAAKTNKAFN